MTDLSKETNHETDVVHQETEKKWENDDYDTSTRRNSDFLYELNLMVVFLSLFSLSSEDCGDCSEEDTKSIKDDDESKAAALSRLYSRKRERDLHHMKPLVRRAHRFQPMIKDSRHGRKM